MSITYTITNTFREDEKTLLVWALFSDDKDRSFRFPLSATFGEIIARLDKEVEVIKQNEIDRQLAYEKIVEQVEDNFGTE